MRRQCLVLGLVIASACSAFSGGDGEADPATPGPDGDAAAEGSPGDGAARGPTDASAPPRCDPAAKFGKPRRIDELNRWGYQSTPRLLPDEKTILFAAAPDDGGPPGLFIATRDRADALFSTPKRVEFAIEADAGIHDTDGWLSPDGLTLFFASTRHVASPTSFDFDLYRATRAGASKPFDNIEHLPGISSLEMDTAPSLVATGDFGVFTSARAAFDGGQLGRKRLFQFTLTNTGWALSAAAVPEVEENDQQVAAALSADGLRLYFGLSTAGPDAEHFTMFSVERNSTSGQFGLAKPVLEGGDVVSTEDDRPGWISPDGCRLYFARGKGFRFNLYMTERGK